MTGLTFDQLTAFLLTAQEASLQEKARDLAEAIPELAPLMGFDQRSPHHAYDVYTHTVKVTARVPAEPVLRWAALLHDCAKPDCFTLDETGRGHMKGHALAGARKAEAILTRLGAPEELIREVTALIGLHMYKPVADRQLLKDLVNRRGKEQLLRLLELQEADMNSKGINKEAEQEQFRQVQKMLEEL